MVVYGEDMDARLIGTDGVLPDHLSEFERQSREQMKLLRHCEGSIMVKEGSISQRHNSRCDFSPWVGGLIVELQGSACWLAEVRYLKVRLPPVSSDSRSKPPREVWISALLVVSKISS